MSARPIAALALLLAPLACAGPTPTASPSAAADDLPRAEPGVLYALGAGFGEAVNSYQFDEDEARELARGFLDSAMRRPYAGVRTEQTAMDVAVFHERRKKELARREELAGAPVLEQAASAAGAVKTESGMIIRVIEPGSGPTPTIFDYVRINYRGTLRDGTVFHSTDGKEPERVQLGTTTRCWQEALGGVAAGARVHVACPPSLGYGWIGWPSVVPGGAVVSYDLELLSVEPHPPPPNWSPG